MTSNQTAKEKTDLDFGALELGIDHSDKDADKTEDPVPPAPDISKNYSSTGWPAFSKGYQKEGFIGEGASAKVYRMTCLEGQMKGRECAVKIIDLEKTNADRLTREVATMKLCRHKNVLELYATFNVSDELWIVMPFMNKGSALDIVHERIRQTTSKSKQTTTSPLTESQVATIIRAICEGLQYLHKNSWVHRDLKAANILINDKGEIKIADFGVAGLLMDYDFVHGTKKIAGTFTGTPCWMAPEVMAQKCGYTNKADIWSLGITSLELAKTYAPYAKEHSIKVLMKTMNLDPPNFDTYKEYEKGGDYKAEFSPSRKFSEFIKNRTLQKDPEKRNSAMKLLSSSFLRNAPAPPASEKEKPSAGWLDFIKMLNNIPSVEDRKEPEPNTMSGVIKVGKQRFAALKEKIRKRIIREKGLTYMQAMQQELLEWQKNEGSKGGMVAAIVEKDIQRELADAATAETTASTPSKADSREHPHAKQNMSTDNLVDENKTDRICDPDRIGLTYFTGSGPNSDAAEAAQKLGVTTSAQMKKIKENENRHEDDSTYDDQFIAMTGGA